MKLRYGAARRTPLTSKVSPVAGMLAPRPFLLLHGDADTILPVETSAVVQVLAGGHGEVVVLPGVGHGLAEAHDERRAVEPVG